MRTPTLSLLAVLLALPAAAQQLSPLTGTTAAPPAATAPAGANPAPATPARRPRMTMQERFDSANTTHDGKLTLAQAQAGHMSAVARHFDAVDTAGHGYVTMDDIRAYNRARRVARRAERAAKPQ